MAKGFSRGEHNEQRFPLPGLTDHRVTTLGRKRRNLDSEGESAIQKDLFALPGGNPVAAPVLEAVATVPFKREMAGFDKVFQPRDGRAPSALPPSIVSHTMILESSRAEHLGACSSGAPASLLGSGNLRNLCNLWTARCAILRPELKMAGATFLSFLPWGVVVGQVCSSGGSRA